MQVAKSWKVQDASKVSETSSNLFSAMDLAALREGIHQFSLKLQHLRGTVACPDFRALTLLEGPDVTTHLAKMKSEAAAALDVELLKCCLEKALQLAIRCWYELFGPGTYRLLDARISAARDAWCRLRVPMVAWELGHLFTEPKPLQHYVKQCGNVSNWWVSRMVREHQHLGKAEGFKLHCPCPSKGCSFPAWNLESLRCWFDGWCKGDGRREAACARKLVCITQHSQELLGVQDCRTRSKWQPFVWSFGNGLLWFPCRMKLGILWIEMPLTWCHPPFFWRWWLPQFTSFSMLRRRQLSSCFVQVFGSSCKESCSGIVPVVVYTHHIAERFLGLSPRGPLVTIEVRSKGLSVMDPLNMRSSSQLGHGCCEEVWQAMGLECRKELISAGFAVRSSMLPLNMQEWQAHIVELEEGLERSRADDAEAGYFVEPNIELIRTSQNDLPSTDTVWPDWSDEGIDGEDNSHNDSDNGDSDSDNGELVLRLIEQQKRRQDDLMQQSKREGVLMRALSNFVSTSEPTAVLVGDVIGLERVTAGHTWRLWRARTCRCWWCIWIQWQAMLLDIVKLHWQRHSKMAKRRAPCVLVFPFFDGWIRDMQQSSHSVQLRSKFADLLLQLPHGLAVVASAVWPCGTGNKVFLPLRPCMLVM